MKRRRLLLRGATLVTVALLICCAGSKVVRVDTAPPRSFPKKGFDHQVFESLLERFVDKRGNVAYQRWHGDEAAARELDSYLAAVALYSPDNAPERFPTQNSRLSYWINVYNACVIKGVLLNWPLQSVMDVKAPLQLKRGQGFFHTLGFVVGGKTYSLLQIENDKIIDAYAEPRIHFVLNCASGSCPVLQPELPEGPELERYLADATRRFMSEERNVFVDHASRRIVLSNIFELYEDEFVNDARRRGLAGGIASYVRSVASESVAAELDRAEGYAVENRVFDWSVNAQEPAGG